MRNSVVRSRRRRDVAAVPGVIAGAVPSLRRDRVSEARLVGSRHPFLRCRDPTGGDLAQVRLPDEAAGVDAVAGALVSAFDQADVALGEAHGRTLDSDLRIAMVRHPDFTKKVRSIVVEFGITTEQSALDRYIRGENVSRAELEQVWKTTTQSRFGVFGCSKLRRLVLKEQVLEKKGKALVVDGAAHFYRTMDDAYLANMGKDIGIARMLEAAYPGRNVRRDSTWWRAGSSLTTNVRPVLMPLRRLPFRDFTAEEFLGQTLIACRGPGGCASVFTGSKQTLGDMADAGVYFAYGHHDRRRSQEPILRCAPSRRIRRRTGRRRASRKARCGDRLHG